MATFYLTYGLDERIPIVEAGRKENREHGAVLYEL